MNGSETIAAIRDLSIIIAAWVLVVVIIPAGIFYIRWCLSLGQVDRNLENIISTVLEIVVRPLTTLTSLLEVVNHIVGLVHRRSPARRVQR